MLPRVLLLACKLDPQGAWAVLQLDFQNAFNCIDRTTLLSEAQHGAILVQLSAVCLRRPYPPVLRWKDALVNERDTTRLPIGPIGFATGLQLVIETIHRSAELLWAMSYLDLDDGLLVRAREDSEVPTVHPR